LVSGIEDKHPDVPQNIEFAAVGALVRHYHAEEEQRQPPTWPTAPGGSPPKWIPPLR
jgi:hypothetical protein